MTTATTRLTDIVDLLTDELRASNPELFSDTDTVDLESFSEALNAVFDKHADATSGTPGVKLGRFDPILARLLTLEALNRTQVPDEVLTLIMGLIRTCMGIADALTGSRTPSFRSHRWQDVLILLMGNEEYLDVVEAFTVDGVILIDLVAATFG